MNLGSIAAQAFIWMWVIAIIIGLMFAGPIGWFILGVIAFWFFNRKPEP